MLIVASTGINSFSEDKIRKIILSGADILRYNISYQIVDDKVESLKRAEKIINDLNSSAKILIDFPTNKIRLGDFKDRIFAVREDDVIILKSANYSEDCHQFLPVETKSLGEKVHVNQAIAIGDGEVAVEVIEIINSETIKARVLNNGIIKYTKTLNIRYSIEDDQFLKYYEEIFAELSDIKFDILAIPYINPEVNQQIKEMVAKKTKDVKVMIKIEKIIDQLELKKICQDQYYSMIIIDRGELGVNAPYEKINIYQKEIIRIANEEKKSVLVTSQILESTMNNYIPNKAEISDLTNMVLEGINGIILCHETAIGMRPAYTISVAKKIIHESEKYKKYLQTKKKYGSN